MPDFHRPDADRHRSLITVSDRVTHTMSEGLGFDWFSTYEPSTYPAPEDDARWERVLAHATWLNINFVRFGQSAKFLTDDKGNFVPGHASFDQLRRLNAWAEARGVSIIADTWFIPKAFQFAPWPGAQRAWGAPDQDYELGVEDIDGYIDRFVVPYLKYVSEEMGCRAVRWYNHFNEPLGTSHQCSTPPGIDDHVRYVEVLAAIRQGLDEAGLKHLGNMGPDTSTHFRDAYPIPHMLEVGADPDPYIQAYCMHHYHSRFDWDRESTNMHTDPMTVTIEEQLADYCAHAHSRGKPYLVTELGMFHYGWATGDPAGIARHDNTVLESEFLVRAMAKGADCVLRWAWLNPGNLDGMWQLIETTDGSDAPVRDPYYGYGTLMRYVDRNAKILATDVASADAPPQTLHAVAVENQDDSRTLLVINDSYADCAPVLVRFPAGAGPVRKIVNDPVRKHQEVAELTTTAGALEHADILSPMSLTVYTTSRA